MSSLLYERVRLARGRRAIAELLGPPTADLARYARAAGRLGRAAPVPCGRAAVLRAAAAAEVLLVGDYHTLPAAQGAFTALVSRLGHRRLVLALEFVPGRAQAACDRFMAGALPLADFLAAVGHVEGESATSWAAMRPLFALARRRRWPIVGIDSANGGALARRDAYAARRILAATRRFGAPVAALIGQFHLARRHLPRALAAAARAQGRPAPPCCVVLQNSEAVWRALAPAGRRPPPAARLAPDRYCLLHTRPVACQDSFLAYLAGAEDS